MYRSYVAIGDSFTEGVGDELSDGRVRGWADFVALGLAAAAGPVDYANLAVRGRKLRPLLDEQLAPAVALGPELISINGGGNDVIRPRVSIPEIARILLDAARTTATSGAHVVLLSSANPSRHLPAGRLVQRRGDELAALVTSRLPIAGVTYVDNWSDPKLSQGRYWSADGLHLNALGHARVASNVLTALEVPVPVEWGVEEVAAGSAVDRSRNSAAYYRTYVLPWIGRRLTGRSSGDGRTAKFAQPITVTPGMSV